jgi:hypothetical protein
MSSQIALERTNVAGLHITHDDDEPFHSGDFPLFVERRGDGIRLLPHEGREVNKLGGVGCVWHGRRQTPALLSYGGSGKFRIAPEQAGQVKGSCRAHRTTVMDRVAYRAVSDRWLKGP